jgi:hypothetical protein
MCCKGIFMIAPNERFALNIYPIFLRKVSLNLKFVTMYVYIYQHCRHTLFQFNFIKLLSTFF